MERLYCLLFFISISLYKTEVVDSLTDHSLMIAITGEISVIDPENGNLTVITNDVYRPKSIDYDSIHGYVYFIDSWNINRFQYPSSSKISIETVISNNTGAQPLCVAVDGLHGYIFWSDNNNNTIQRSFMDGSGEEKVINTPDVATSLYIDPKTRWLYYTVDFVMNGIQKYRLNGSNSHSILSEYFVMDFTIDRATSMIYCYNYFSSIFMATLEGDFIRWLRSPLFIRQIDVFNETVYYLGYGNNIYNFDTNSTEWKHLWKSFSTIYDMIIVEHVISEECRSYTETDQLGKRSSDYEIDLFMDLPISDHTIIEGWYRHNSENGDVMPTSPPGVNHCGTMNPVWLNGELPTKQDGNVSREVCIQSEDDICKDTLEIKISNCGSFFVYYLIPTPKNDSYCFGSGVVACPGGMSSETGYYPGCSSSYPRVSVSVTVQATLTEGKSYQIPFYPPTPSLESVFRCHFDISSPELYVYDVIWYINGNKVKRMNNVLYGNINTTVLRNSDWIEDYQMNMEVHCALRLRETANAIPSPYHRSSVFPAGLFPDELEYTVVEGQSVHISFRATVPVGCMASHVNLTAHCSQNLYLHQPDKSNVQSGCVNNIASKDIIFKAQFCGIKLSTNDWKDEKYLEVIGYSDGLYNNKGRTTFIHVGTSSLSFLNEHWRNIQVPEIKVTVIDKDATLTNRLCQSNNDPHISTYDGKYYHFMDIGEFVMYRNDKGPYWVHALLTNCGFGWDGSACHCGIAIRSRQSLFVLRTCKIISRTKKELLPNPITNVKICDENDLHIESNRNKYKIKLPIGTEITLSISRWSGFIGTVTIKPSIYDIDEAKGLCGFPSVSRNPSDDYMHRYNGPINDDQEFAKSWRVTSSDEQLFVEEPQFLTDYVVGLNYDEHQQSSSLNKYCLCEDKAGSTQDLGQFNKVNCNLTESTEYCSIDSISTTGSVVTFQYKECRSSRRRRRSLVEQSDDIIEFTPLELDDDDITSGPRTFRNNWTRETAYIACQEQLEETIPADTYKEFLEISVDNFIESCVKDIELTGDTSFLSDTIDAMVVNIMTELTRNESLYAVNSTKEGKQTILEDITSRLCLNNCSSNGKCVRGLCICNVGHMGDDCSIESSNPPRNISVPVSGLCRLGERECRKTNLYGKFLSEDVWYKIRKYKIGESDVQYTTGWVSHKAEYRNMFMVTVDLHEPRSKRSATEQPSKPEGYDISLSYDGQNYGEHVAVIVYDDECYSCNSSFVCISSGNCDISVSNDHADNKNEKSKTVTVIAAVSCIVIVVLCAIIGFVIFKLKFAGPKSKIDIFNEQIKGQGTKNSFQRESTTSDVHLDGIFFTPYDKIDRQVPPKSFVKQRDHFNQ